MTISGSEVYDWYILFSNAELIITLPQINLLSTRSKLAVDQIDRQSSKADIGSLTVNLFSSRSHCPCTILPSLIVLIVVIFIMIIATVIVVVAIIIVFAVVVVVAVIVVVAVVASTLIIVFLSPFVALQAYLFFLMLDLLIH
ncbi:hypothetical protein Tco_0644698 [Tanacetum coccineum]